MSLRVIRSVLVACSLVSLPVTSLAEQKVRGVTRQGAAIAGASNVPAPSSTFGTPSTDAAGRSTTDEEMQRFFLGLQAEGTCNRHDGPCVNRIRRIRGTGDRGARYLIAQYETGSFDSAAIFEYVAHTGSDTGNSWLLAKASEASPWKPGDSWVPNAEATRIVLHRRWAIRALGWMNEESVIDQLLPMLDSEELMVAGKATAVASLRNKLIYGDLGEDPWSPRASVSAERRTMALTKLNEVAADPSRHSRLRESAARAADRIRSKHAP